MTDLMIRLLAWVNKERGQGAGEYIVMTAAVVAVIAAVIFTAYELALTDAVEALGTAITDAVGAAG